MRGYLAVLSGTGAVIIIAIMSRSVSRQKVFSARTSRRVVQRMVEACTRALAQDDVSPTMNIVHATTARTWAEATLMLSSEEAVKRVTGFDMPHLVDKSQRKIDASVRAMNHRLPRHSRIQPDRLLASS